MRERMKGRERGIEGERGGYRERQRGDRKREREIHRERGR